MQFIDLPSQYSGMRLRYNKNVPNRCSDPKMFQKFDQKQMLSRNHKGPHISIGLPIRLFLTLVIKTFFNILRTYFYMTFPYKTALKSIENVTAFLLAFALCIPWMGIALKINFCSKIFTKTPHTHTHTPQVTRFILDNCPKFRKKPEI